LAEPPGSPIQRLIAFVDAEFQQVRVIRHDATPVRTIVNIECRWGRYNVRIAETVGPAWCRYSYYVLDGPSLVVGFDNAADRPAVRLRFAHDWLSHIHERLPHRHGPAEGELRLTPEMTCEDFLAWLKTNLPVE
jgi:hypothetical protein